VLVVGVCFQAQVTFDMVPGAFIEVGVPPDEEIMQILGKISSSYFFDIGPFCRTFILGQQIHHLMFQVQI